MRSNFFGNCQSSLSLPMDLITGWLGAWSLTRLKQSFSGAAINVRRSSDNAVTDVTYDDQGKISGASLISAGGDLATWAGVDLISIATIYDLSGNGRNFITSTASFQPQLVLNAMSGQAVARFAGTQRLLMSTALNTEFNSFFCLHNIAAVPGARGVIVGNFNGSFTNSSATEKNVNNNFRVFWDGDLVIGLTNAFGQINVSSFLRDTTAVTTILYEGNTVDNSANVINNAVSNVVEHGMGADRRNALPALAIPLTGDLCTVMMYQTNLTNAQRIQISRSLAHIGGLNV